MPKIDEIINKLDLEKHPMEGGFFRRTYTSKIITYFSNLGEERPLASAIYYLFDKTLVSKPHSLKQDEIWHFYCGSSLEILLIYPDDNSEILTMGSDILNDNKVQVVIPAGTIFAAKIQKDGAYALIGATLSPAFAYSDYKEEDSLYLMNKFPQYKEFLQDFTSRNEVK